MYSTKFTIIICFSYHQNSKYTFNPEHLRSDLRRILSFSLNNTGSDFSNTYIISDIKPNQQLQDEIYHDFCQEIIQYLSEQNININVDATDLNQYMKFTQPLKWLQYICKNNNKIYDQIRNTILPIVRSSNVIEFANLFTNYIQIQDQNHFDQLLQYLYSQSISNLLFYYTGHCVRTKSNNFKLSLVIPSINNSKVGFYNCYQLQKRFDIIINNVPSFIIFDCCHAETILNFPRISKQNSIYLSSTQSSQTCGFYISNTGKCEGSLFTYYFIRLLHYIAQNKEYDLCKLDEINENIKLYRKLSGKNPQTITLKLLNDSITQFPLWLFDSSQSLVFEEY